MKKLITLLLALTLALCFPLAALAEEELVVEDGEDITVTEDTVFSYIEIRNGSLTIAAGKTVKASGLIFNRSSLTICEGASLKLDTTFSGYDKLTLDVFGTYKGPMPAFAPYEIFLHDGAVVEFTAFRQEEDIADLKNALADYCVTEKNGHIIAHGSHDYQGGKCVNCGASAPTASTLSRGSATVVCTIAAFVLGFAAATVIFTRKKAKG